MVHCVKNPHKNNCTEVTITWVKKMGFDNINWTKLAQNKIQKS